MTVFAHPKDGNSFESEVSAIGSNDFQGKANKADAVTIAPRAGGPRTAKGKEKSKYNALKHGIFSKVVLLEDESKAEYTELIRGLLDDFQPVGKFEEGLVEILAVTRWRQRRLIMAETLEIEGARVLCFSEAELREQEEADKLMHESSDGGLITRIANPTILVNCLRWLRSLKLITEATFDHPSAHEILRHLYGSYGLFLTYRIHVFSFRAPENQRVDEGLPSQEKSKAIFLSELDQEIERLSCHLEAHSDLRTARLELESRRQVLPDSRRLDQLIRYSASLERTFDRTLSQLERAQRVRRGQPVLPELNLKVSS